MMPGLHAFVAGFAALILLAGCPRLRAEDLPAGSRGGLDGVRHRIVVSTDIGGTDPDDVQSLIHLLLHSDLVEIEGLISSPYGPGRKGHILEVLDAYAGDHPRLVRHSAAFPDPAQLRAITRQGETEVAPWSGHRNPTEGSAWLAACARRPDPRPLRVLVWGGLEDLAQAVHDAPDIVPRLRVYWIGGPNKKWSTSAYLYLLRRHPDLWFIEANATYRGWFVGGSMPEGWSNRDFVRTRVAGRGSLGRLFAGQLAGTLKMGDSPSVGWVLRGDPDRPDSPGWGGSFVRAWERPYLRLDRMPVIADSLEVFGVLDLTLQLGEAPPGEWVLVTSNQELSGERRTDGTMRFLFSPKAPGRHEFRVRRRGDSSGERVGAITVTVAPAGRAAEADRGLASWWTDDPAPERAEQGHPGARTVNRWRTDYLREFARRLEWCRP